MIRSFFFLCFLTLLFACDTASTIKQPSKNYFLKYYGGDGDQIAKDLIVNKDGTFYVLGNSTQSDASLTKVYIAKVDALGEVIKQITYGTFSMDAKDFELTSDGKLAVVANRKSSSNDVLLSRFSLDLILLDSAIVSQSLGLNSFANSLTELSDGGFIIEGFQGDPNAQADPSAQASEMHLRVDKSLKDFVGQGGWAQTAGAGTLNVGIKSIQHAPTIFYTFGYTNALYDSKNEKFWAYKLGYNGSFNGNGDFGLFESSGGSADKKITDAIKVVAGGYLLVGISDPLANFSLKAAITYSTDSAFNFQTSGVYKDLILLNNLGSGPNPYATAFSATSYNFILANTYNTPSGNSDIILLKVSNDLNPLWTNLDGSVRFAQFGGSGEDTSAAVAELPDGHIMVLGTMRLGNPPEQYKIVLMKLSANGQLSD